jgi:cytochrome oxidase Cu insertion factor (SCO1/SenC/PrrC family)
MSYVIGHSAGAHIFDPDGKIRPYVKDDASVGAIVSDLIRVLHEAS